MPNYMELLGEHYSGVGVTCDGDPTDYDNLTWTDGDALPTEATLDATDFECYKAAKVVALSASCVGDIVNGFQSVAGGLHAGPGKWYDSAMEDQINLMGSAAAGDTMDFPCRDTQGGSKNYVEHTHLQLEAVLQDGRDVKLTALQNFTSKRDTVLACTDLSCVDAVTW